jgi:hypothetical protein
MEVVLSDSVHFGRCAIEAVTSQLLSGRAELEKKGRGEQTVFLRLFSPGCTGLGEKEKNGPASEVK